MTSESTAELGQLIAWMTERLSSALRVKPRNVDIDLPFIQLGLSSLDAIQLAADLSAHLGRKVSPVLLFDYPTLRSLATHLVLNLDEAEERSKRGARMQKSYSSDDPVVVIGMECRFPGAPDIDAFWSLLEGGVNAVLPAQQGRNGFAGGYLENVDRFDAAHFGIPSREAEAMDPQQRLLLETSWSAIERAGYSPVDLTGTDTGVFIGISSFDYSQNSLEGDTQVDVLKSLGNAHSIAANRLSYFYNFRGPSFAVDTACSSSLVALHTARQSLLRGECSVALAGGVNLILSAGLSHAFTRAGMLSPDGRCKTFSKEANGYVRGEGVGVLVLKRQSDAIRDGDRILAVLRGSAINQDGRTNGMTAPSGLAQQEVIRTALDEAGLQPHEVDYIEAHGTGTRLGDPIEFRALAGVFAERPSEVPPLLLGSVKTNIGHLEAAAGMAGVIKTILSMRNRKIPAHLHLTEINPEIAAVGSPIQIVSTSRDWPSHAGSPRIAGVSSFGFGGANAHVVIAEAEESVAPNGFGLRLSPRTHLLPLSASSAPALRELAERTIAYLDRVPSASIEDLCYSAMIRREPLTHRLAIIGTDLASLRLGLQEYLDGKSSPRWVAGKKSSGRLPKVAFLFTGQGSQGPGMGLGLLEYQGSFREDFYRSIALLQPEFDRDLLDVLRAEDESSLNSLYRTDYGQALLFALEHALATTWAKLGVRPDMVLGHSLGEIVAATVGGYLSQADACRLVAARGQAMENTAPGKMLIVYAESDRLRTMIGEIPSPESVSIAAINGPKLTVLSGTPESIDLIEARCATSLIRTKALKSDRGFHSALMDPALDGFEHEAKTVEISANEWNVPLISCLTRAVVAAGEIDAKFWRRHLRETTHFVGAIQTLAEREPDLVIELGPHPTLVSMAKECLPGHSASWIATLNAKESADHAFLRAVAQVYVSGHAISWRELEPNATASRFDLPLTPFSGERFWIGRDLQTSSSLLTSIEPGKSTMKKSTKKTEAEITSAIRDLLADHLQIDAGQIDPKASLLEMGADSLVLLNALEQIKEIYRVELSIHDVFGELSTLEKISAYLVASMPEPVEALEAAVVPQGLTRTPVSATQIAMPQIPQMTGTDSPLEQLIQHQLQVMALQLQMLQGSGSTLQPVAPASFPSAPAVPAARRPSEPAAPSGRGVLGNFSSRAKTTDEVASSDDVREAYLKSLIARFTAKTAKSKALAGDHRKALADNRQSAGFRPRTKEMIYPIVCDEAKGSRFKDVDGNEYIDLTMGFGVNLFGHNPDFIQSALVKQLDRAITVGPQSRQAGEVAELVSELTGHERVAFLNSGTEAIMAAIRLARAATKRSKIVLFEGSYHGHFDGVLGRAAGNGETVPVAPGVPDSLSRDVIVLEYGTAESLERIRKLAPELAAVMVESVQSRYPELQPVEFLREIRKITAATQTAYIWDEVIHGFRVAQGGAQEHFGIQGDLAVYGKVLGGGLPIGAIAGQSRFLDFIDGGDWKFGDASYPPSEMTFFAGTFCKHPLAMAAAFEVLKKLKSEGPELLSKLNDRTAALSDELNAAFESRGCELRIVHFGSLFRFKFTGNADWLFHALNEKGVYVWEGRNMFLSTAHTDADLREIVRVVLESVDELIAIGYLKGHSPQPPSRPKAVEASSTLSLINPHDRFLKLHALGGEAEQSCHIALALRLQGELDEVKLQECVRTTLLRHDGLAAIYRPESAQVDFFPNRALPLPTVDFSELKDPESRVREWMKEQAGLTFDFKSTPIRFHLVKLSATDHILTLVGHHLALDGLSAAILCEEISKLYTGSVNGTDPKLNKARSFAEFMQDYPAFIQRLSAAPGFWEARVKTFPEKLRLQSETNGTRSFEGGRIRADLNAEEFKQVRNFGFKNSSSLITTLMACLSATMKERLGIAEAVVGVPIMGHSSISESMVGNCVNLCPILSAVAPDGQITSTIPLLKARMLESFRNGEYPLEWIEKLAGRKLIDLTLNVEPISKLPDFGKAKPSIYTHPVVASEYPIMVNAMKDEGTLQIELDYQSWLFDEKSAAAFLDDLKARLLAL